MGCLVFMIEILLNISFMIVKVFNCSGGIGCVSGYILGFGSCYCNVRLR